MELATLERLKMWFSGYCESFYSADPEHQRNIALKEEHTLNVCADMTLLAESAGMRGGPLATAEAVALFHDVGRFEQYRQYRTFRDADSVNHAALGVRVLRENGVLDEVDEAERRIICQSVSLHNVFAVPNTVAPESLAYLKLIRDADKLDIWRVFIELFQTPAEHRASAAVLGLPETAEYTEELLCTLYERKMINLSRLNTANDFKLLQLSWIFDLNTAASFRLIHDRDYIRRLAATLPQDSRIERAVSFLHQYVEERIRVDLENQEPDGTFDSG